MSRKSDRVFKIKMWQCGISSSQDNFSFPDWLKSRKERDRTNLSGNVAWRMKAAPFYPRQQRMKGRFFREKKRFYFLFFWAFVLGWTVLMTLFSIFFPIVVGKKSVASILSFCRRKQERKKLISEDFALKQKKNWEEKINERKWIISVHWRNLATLKFSWANYRRHQSFVFIRKIEIDFLRIKQKKIAVSTFSPHSFREKKVWNFPLRFFFLAETPEENYMIYNSINISQACHFCTALSFSPMPYFILAYTRLRCLNVRVCVRVSALVSVGAARNQPMALKYLCSEVNSLSLPSSLLSLSVSHHYAFLFQEGNPLSRAIAVWDDASLPILPRALGRKRRSGGFYLVIFFQAQEKSDF